MRKPLLAIAALFWVASSCRQAQPTATEGTFGYDLNFLKGQDSNLVILRSGDQEVIVSPRFQGKVFTSTADGEGGHSFGWIHYKGFGGPASPHINVYGGESRLWLGPEGGKFSLYFSPGAKMEFPNWQTPAPIDTEAWTLSEKSDQSAFMQKDMQLVNYAGTRLSLNVSRRVTLYPHVAIDSLLMLAPDTSVKAVGYLTQNVLTNKGSSSWTAETGMPCLWVLDMFPPSPSTTIVIPYHNSSADTAAKPATTNYFGEIASDRIHFENNVLFFRADGKSRGKLGMHPPRAANLMGSYDAQHQVLTIVRFDSVGTADQYLNQEWNTTKPPFSGDAANAYNDGPLADGSQLGPFYELESVSPAAFLGPGQALTHNHSVFHFTGPEASLDRVATKVLGVSLEQIKGALK